MAEVILKNIKKVYPQAIKKGFFKKRNNAQKSNTASVDNINLEIKDKEFIVLVGPSGCGKSTTLRMIAGLETITEGDLYIDGKRVNDLTPKERDIAMVFQNYALYPHMTVYENMAFSMKLAKMPKNVIDEKVKEAAEILDITTYLNRKPKALSGGQRQRVAIGRAIVRNPKVFLMDEPLSNLDAKLRNQMRAEIIKLRQRVNTTFIYVTHDQIEAMTLGDRIVVMKDGEIQQIGTPQEVFDKPRNLFVAGFIGMPQMNIIPDVLLKKKDEGYEISIKGKTFSLSHEMSEQLKARNIDDCEVKLGIRPSHLFLNKNGLETKIDVVEMMGGEVHIHLKLNDIDIVAAIPLEGSNTYTSGQLVNLNMNLSMIHLFDIQTGKNILYCD